MKLKEAIDLILNEAETSALGESTKEGDKVLEAIELYREFHQIYGRFFENYVSSEENKIIDFPQDNNKQ